jgi:hypothetical protein
MPGNLTDFTCANKVLKGPVSTTVSQFLINYAVIALEVDGFSQVLEFGFLSSFSRIQSLGVNMIGFICHIINYG